MKHPLKQGFKRKVNNSGYFYPFHKSCNKMSRKIRVETIYIGNKNKNLKMLQWYVQKNKG